MKYFKVKNLLLSALVVIYSCEGEQGPTGEQGGPGINSLVNIVDENPGSNCEAGGIKIEIGLDNNSNGVLDEIEVNTTNYVCNGEDGNNSITRVENEPMGGICQNGGIKISSGIDINNDGVLQDDEINTTAYVCNGIDGNNMLIRTTIEEEGENCESGGLKIEYGLDINNDGLLNDDEVSYTKFICNGVDGSLSLVNVNEEPIGENCENGGIRIDSGVDDNNNAILDDEEIDVTTYVCNGINGIINEEVRIRLGNGIGSIANTTSSTPVIAGGTNFDIRDFQNVDTIFFESDPWVGNSSNFARVELYNQSDNAVIPNTLIRTNNLSENREVIQSPDIFNEIPGVEINLRIRLSSEIDGEFAASGISYLVLRTAN